MKSGIVRLCPWATSRLPIFVNKAVLEYTHIFVYILPMAVFTLQWQELSTHKLHKAKNIHSALSKKKKYSYRKAIVVQWVKPWLRTPASHIEV